MEVPYLKIILAIPRLIAAAKRLLERNEVTFRTIRPESSFAFRAFEANIDFEIRFMADTKVVGCNWIELPKAKYRVRKKGGNFVVKHLTQDVQPLSSLIFIEGVVNPVSRCQIEVDISYEDFISHAPEGAWADVAPLRILSFDIECAGRKGIFPEPEKDPVIQIANMVIRQVGTKMRLSLFAI